MKITNNHNLPEAVYNAVNKVYQPKSGRISVTDLINPPQMRHLKMKHWDELEEDCADRLWLLFGSAVHYIMEQGAPPDALAEEKLEVVIAPKIVIAGRSDLYHNECVEDYKVVRAMSEVYSDPEQYEPQMNVYAWMYRRAGFAVNKLRVVKFYRDWNYWDKVRHGRYPEIPMGTVDIEVWSHQQVEDYVQGRIAMHLQNPPPPCTAEDMWLRPDKFAVKMENRKSAVRVYSTAAEAEAHVNELKKEKKYRVRKPFIETRPGEPVRCLGREGKPYCIVGGVCPQWLAVKDRYVFAESPVSEEVQETDEVQGTDESQNKAEGQKPDGEADNEGK